MKKNSFKTNNIYKLNVYFFKNCYQQFFMKSTQK